MARVKLTQALLNRLLSQTSPKVTFRYLVDESGLTLVHRTTPNGSTLLYQFRKRFKGHLYVKAIGGYPAMSIAAARNEFAAMVTKLVHTGSLEEEEKAQVQEPAAAPTFGELLDRFLEFKKARVKASSFRAIDNLFKHTAVLRPMPITEVTAQVAYEQVFSKLTDRPAIMGNLKIHILSFGRYLVAIEATLKNPFEGLRILVQTEQGGHLRTFADNELQERMTDLFNKCADLPLEQQALIHFHFFVPLRKTEVYSITLDQAHNASEVTVKTKTMDAFTMPLPEQAQKIVAWAYKHKRPLQKFLFCGRRDPTAKVNPTTCQQIFEARKIDFTIHSVRSCMTQYLIKYTDVKETVANLCLSHVVGGAVEQAYNRGSYLEERRHALQLWADFVEKCIGPHKFY